MRYVQRDIRTAMQRPSAAVSHSAAHTPSTEEADWAHTQAASFQLDHDDRARLGACCLDREADAAGPPGKFSMGGPSEEPLRIMQCYRWIWRLRTRNVSPMHVHSRQYKGLDPILAAFYIHVRP